MSLDEKAIRKVARLSRIKLNDAEIVPMQDKLNIILGMVEELQSVNTDNVEPLASAMEIIQPLRKDKVTDGDILEKILANAPEELQKFFVVPKVVE